MRRKPTQRILSGLLSILMLCSIVMGTGAFTAFAEEAEPVVHAAEASTLEEGLILHSNFNDGAATDLSGNGHDGVVNGAVEFAEVEPGDLAVKITKQTKPCEDKVLGTDYVDYGKSADIIPATGDFSISLWYCSIGTTPSNTSVLGDKAYRSGSNTGICFGIVSSDLCYNFATSNSRVEMKGSTGNFGALKGCTSDETWHHLVCTFDRDGDMVGYVDGEKVGALSIASHVGRSVDAGLNLVLGAGGDYCNAINNAWMDDLRIYDRVLSGSEVKELSELSDVEQGGPVLTFERDNKGVLGLGDVKRVYLDEIEDYVIADVTYTTNNENVTVSENGTIQMVEGYAPKAGETVTVTAVVTYYDNAEDVIFADSFEGEKQFDNQGLYAHSDVNSLFGRHAVTPASTSTGYPAHALDEVSDVTVTAWYHDLNGGADQTKYAFSINGAGNALGVVFDKSIAAYVNDTTKTHYAARVNGYTYNNYSWGTTDAARSNGWHKFEWVIDSEKGLTEKIDGKVISTNTIVGASGTNHDLVKVENYEKVKSLNNLTICMGWNNNATNMGEIQDRYFIDGVTVVKNGASTATKTVKSIAIPMSEEEAPLDPAFEELRLAWREYLLGGDGTDLDMTNEAVSNYVNKLNSDANSAWEKLIKSDETREDRIFPDGEQELMLLTPWPTKSDSTEAKERSAAITRSFGYLRTLALAWSTEGCDLYHNEEVLTEIIDATDYVVDGFYFKDGGRTNSNTYGNWYHWDISSPTNLGNIAMVLYDQLGKTKAEHYATAMQWYAPQCQIGGPHSYQTGGMTGGNLLLKANVTAQAGILLGNAAMLDNVQAQVKKTVGVYNDADKLFSTGNPGDGFYRDGSYIQHQALPYIAGYGRDLYNNFSIFGIVLKGSEWEISFSEKEDPVIFDFVFEGVEPFMYDTHIMDLVTGRAIVRKGYSDHSQVAEVISALVPMHGTFPTDEQNARFDSMIKYYLSLDPDYYLGYMANIYSVKTAADILNDETIQPRKDYTLTKTFGMDRTVHITPDFGVGIAMQSTRTFAHEIIGEEGKRTWNIANGMFFLYNEDVDQFNGSYWCTVDPTRLPGTTAEHVVYANGIGSLNANIYDWTGGSSIGGSGVAGMYMKALSRNDPKNQYAVGPRTGADMKKSYFMFGDRILMLGSSITSTTGDNVETIVENRKIDLNKAVVTIDGQEAALTEPAVLSNPKWMHLNGAENSNIGYYFPEGITLHAMKDTRTANWNQQGGDSGEETDSYATFYVDHGKNPKNAGYAYMILPGMTADETAAYAAAPDVEILQRDGDIHAARDNKQNITAVNFWNAGSIAGISVDKPASVTMERKGDILTIGVSEPTQRDVPLTVTVDVAGEVISKDDTITVARADSQIQYSINTTDSLGGTHTISIRVSDDARLTLSSDELKSTETQHLLVVDNKAPVDSITYTTDAADKVVIDKDGSIRVKDGYKVTEGEQVQVTATIQAYDPADVLFYENFEPKEAGKTSGELTKQSEYGRFQGNDWGGTLGFQFPERAYVITDVNPVEGAPAARTGYYGVTQVDHEIVGSQAPYTHLEQARAGTMGFWYYDTFAEDTGANDRFGAMIPNRSLIDDKTGSNPARSFFAGLSGDKAKYGYRVESGGQYGTWTVIKNNGERSKGWHKFEFKVDAETGMTLFVDGKETEFKDASKKSIETVALGANFAAQATNIRGRHFIDDLYVVKPGAKTTEKTLTTTITLVSGEAPVEPPVDVNYNIAPDAIKKEAANKWDAAHEGFYAADRSLDTRWAVRSSNGPAILTLTFDRMVNVFKAGLNSYGDRITGFRVEYLDGSEWKVAYEYKGVVTGVTGGATAANTHYYEFPAVMSDQIRLVLPQTSGDPSIWEFELYEAPTDGTYLMGAEAEQAVTSAGGDVKLNLKGVNLEDSEIVAHVGGQDYKAEVTSGTDANVTVKVPANTTERDKTCTITFSLNGELTTLKLKLTVPAGKEATEKLWLQYNSPAPADGMTGYGSGSQGYKNWQNWTLPIGNGYQGANIYGLVDLELMQISEESLWTGGVGGDYSDMAAIGLKGRDGNDITSPAAYRAARDAGLGKAGDVTPPSNQAINDALKAMFPARTGGENQGRIALGNYQSFAEVFYDFTHDGKSVSYADVEDYLRWLDIENALSGVSYSYNGVTYTRESFASYPDRVIVNKISADQDGKVEFTLNPTVPHASEKENIKVTADAASKTISLSGSLKQNGMRFAAKFQLITDGTVKAGEDKNGNGTLIVTGATDAVVIMSLGTDYLNDYSKRYRTGVDPMPAVVERLDKAMKKGFDQLRADHVADYKSIFDNVTLDLGGEGTNMNTDALLSQYRNDNNITSQRPATLRFLEELYFQYGRYLLISSSREGTLPANLQGVWNRETKPMWQSDYHLNINLQMNYWPANNTNMEETLYALVDYMDSLRKPGREVAYRAYGVGDGDSETATGWVAHVSSNPFGFTGFFDWHTSDTSAGHAQYSPESAMWMMQNIYNMYQYYPNETYLRERIYPIMREAALFYSDEEILVYDPASGRMVMSPTYSSEHGPMWGGDTFQQQLLWQLFTDVIEASEILDVDGEQDGLRAKLQDLLPKLSAEGDNGPVPIAPTSGKNMNGQNAPGVKEWWWETGYYQTEAGGIPGAESNHRHLSHLVGLFPGNLITKDTTEWMEAAKGSLIRRGDDATGWSRGMKTNLWARTGDGNHAYKIFDGLLASATLNNLWDYHTGPYFQIDGNLGGTAGVIEMLMQSHAGYIEPLPALPDAWPQGTVTGLTMRGGFTVDMTWADKAVTSMQVTSDAGQDCSVKYLDENGEALYVKVTCNGADVPVTRDAKGISTFETVKGNVYDVTFTTEGEAHEHVFDQKNTDPKFQKSAATCTEPAVYYYSCQCGEKGTETFTSGEALGHDYKDVVTAPTCEDKGYTTHTCSRCGHSYVDGEVAALGHSYESVVTAPTCEDKGYTTHTCSRCGHSYVDGEVEALGHEYESVVTAPTCTEKGYTTHTCSRCGDSYVDTYVEALGHKGGTATCKHKAVCEVCGKAYGELDPSNHEGPKVIHNQMDPTTEHDGYTGDVYCGACGKLIEKGEVIDKLPEEKPEKPENPFIPNRPAPVKPVGPTAPEFPFTDVHENDWFYEEVKSAWENDLVDGVSATKYAPNETLTVASAIKLAAALHQMDNDGYVSLKNGAPVWYSTYVDYAVENGVIEESYLNYTAAQMNAPVTRAEFIHIFYGAMDNYDVINDVKDDHIPDVKMTDKYADEIYTFYRAGILTGCDSKGSCRPATVITRGEVAAILIRMYDVTARVRITL